MREPTRPRLSGWCSPYCTPRSHGTCQERIDHELLECCECAARGGHERQVHIEDPSPETTALIERLDHELNDEKESA